MTPAGPIEGSPPVDIGSPAAPLIILQKQITKLKADLAIVSAGTVTTLTGDVTGGPPAAGVITTVIAPLAVTSGKIANAAVTALKIQSGAIINAHVNSGAGILLSKLEMINEANLVGRAFMSGGGVPEQVTPLQLVEIIENQIGGPIGGGGSLDPTLVAFGALTIAADSLTIGTGVDAFIQTVFGANTFPAKASTGNLVAKTITDFGLSLIDDANSSAARTTLGLVIGTNVQAFDADLTTWAGITPAAGIAAFLADPSSSNFAAAITNETGSGLVVLNVAPAFLGATTFTASGGGSTPITATGQVEPVAVINLIPGSGGTNGGQILSLFAPNLGNGNNLFFAIGKSWTPTNSAYFGFQRDATDTNTFAQIGHWGKDSIFKVYKSGGCAVGAASVDPGDTNFNVQGAYRKNNTQVVGARDTGWVAMTNTANKNTAYDTTTVTLPQLAARVKSLQDALTTHGLIGA